MHAFVLIIRFYTRSAAFLSLPVLLISGCARSPGAAARPQGVMIVAVDRSVNGSAARDTQILQLSSLTKAAAESRYPFDFWVYDSGGAKHLWGPDRLAADDQLDSLQNKYLPPDKSRARKPAKVGALLEAISAEPGLASAPSIRIVLLTDGALPGKEDAGLSAGAKSLAQHSGWQIEALDIAPQYQPQWKQALSSALGSRWEVVSERDATNLLKQNHDE